MKAMPSESRVEVVRLTQCIEDQLHKVDALYHRLVLVVGRPRTGKTSALRALSSTRNWPRVNVNLTLSEALIELTVPQRALKADSLMRDYLTELDSEVVLLDNIEILFHPELRLDPLRLLQSLARNQKLVAAWPGELNDNVLIYAEPGHPEFKKYLSPEAVIVNANASGDLSQPTGNEEPS